jgi:hypothetical protein
MRSLKRMLIWRHNGLLGHAAMISRNAMTIMDCPTATEESKEQARIIYEQAILLGSSLRTRIDRK